MRFSFSGDPQGLSVPLLILRTRVARFYQIPRLGIVAKRYLGIALMVAAHSIFQEERIVHENLQTGICTPFYLHNA